MKPRYKWQPLQQGVMPPPNERVVNEWLRQMPGRTREQALAYYASEDAATTVWVNDLYQVQRREMQWVAEHETVTLVHLNIRRRDGGPIMRDWRHFQWIKNQLIGEECEAIELYPAESRLVDTSNKFHLYGVLDPTFRFPIHMFDQRDVQYDSGTTPGTRQRPL